MDYIRLWNHVDQLPWCALVTTGRTGTDFFQSLLDSHPQISVFNGIHFFHSFWLHAQSVNYGGPLILDDVLDEYIGAHLHKLRTRYDVVEQKGELGDNGDSEIAIDRDAFRQHVRELLRDRPVTSRNFLLGVQTAFDLCLDRDVSESPPPLVGAPRRATWPSRLPSTCGDALFTSTNPATSTTSNPKPTPLGSAGSNTSLGKSMETSISSSPSKYGVGSRAG